MRLTTFNVLHGRSLSDDRVDLDRYAESIRSLDADVLALQEVDRDQPRSHGADLTALAADAMGAVAHRFSAAISGTPGAAWTAATGEEQPGVACYGIALLSRHPVSHWHVVRLPPVPRRVPMLFGHPRRVTMVSDEPRVALVARVEVPHAPVTVATTHLSFVPGWNLRQLRRLTGALSCFDGPFVLMGDLNMGPRQARRSTGMKSLASVLTFPAERPRLQLDHILASGALSAAQPASAVQLPLSDHRALSVQLADHES